MCVRVLVWACACENVCTYMIYVHVNIYTQGPSLCLYAYVYTCVIIHAQYFSPSLSSYLRFFYFVRVCVCVCERERKRECACVCM